MKERKLHELHKRCTKLLKIIMDLEKTNSYWRHFIDEITAEEDLSVKTLESVNNELDENNKQIQKAWVLYKETRKQIKEIE